jgi:hypothetical protein
MEQGFCLNVAPSEAMALFPWARSHPRVDRVSGTPGLYLRKLQESQSAMYRSQEKWVTYTQVAGSPFENLQRRSIKKAFIVLDQGVSMLFFKQVIDPDPLSAVMILSQRHIIESGHVEIAKTECLGTVAACAIRFVLLGGTQSPGSVQMRCRSIRQAAGDDNPKERQRRNIAAKHRLEC